MEIKIFTPSYNRKEITPGILHFGVGNFHRAHQEYYTNMLLGDSDQKSWGICGAMILKQDEAIFRKLQQQQGRYGLTVFSRIDHTKDEYHQIDSLIELLWGIENPAAVIDKVSDPDIKIISLTITEGGYNLFNFSHPDLIHDLTFPEKPKTAFGYVAAGLLKRMKNGAGPVTILCCDNLPHNGDVCGRSFLSFFEKADTQLYQWAKENISFPNTMVDRITPAALPDDTERLQGINGHEDLVPVYCEDFVQWVVEDRFVAGRPAWERVGAEFTEDVSKYESMKLGFVNSTHQMMSFAGFLAGYRKVDEAMADPRIFAYLQQYMDLDVTPYLSPPPNTDFALYKKTFLERLKNKTISDQLSRLCFDAANKIPVFMVPTVSSLLHAKADPTRIAFFTAAYRAYLRKREDEKGESYKINDPGLTKTDWDLTERENPLDFLDLSCLNALPLKSSIPFVEKYLQHCDHIEKKGILATMENLLR